MLKKVPTSPLLFAITENIGDDRSNAMYAYLGHSTATTANEINGDVLTLMCEVLVQQEMPLEEKNDLVICFTKDLSDFRAARVTRLVKNSCHEVTRVELQLLEENKLPDILPNFADVLQRKDLWIDTPTPIIHCISNDVGNEENTIILAHTSAAIKATISADEISDAFWQLFENKRHSNISPPIEAGIFIVLFTEEDDESVIAKIEEIGWQEDRPFIIVSLQETLPEGEKTPEELKEQADAEGLWLTHYPNPLFKLLIYGKPFGLA